MFIILKIPCQGHLLNFSQHVSRNFLMGMRCLEKLKIFMKTALWGLAPDSWDFQFAARNFIVLFLKTILHFEISNQQLSLAIYYSTSQFINPSVCIND